MQLSTNQQILHSNCLGCKRYFLIHQKLPLESMTIQFKNYAFPFKDSNLKYVISKTIVAFLNSKGGFMFIGVDDTTGQVLGMKIGRKQMDEFKLMIKQMLQKIQPQVDLVKHQQVSVDFIPVLQGKQKNFYGKYVIKFIVLQGETSKLYCLSEKVKLSNFRTDEGQIIYAFRRHNLGGIEEIRGIRVIHQIYEKARNPHKIYQTFHENCNPNPITPILSERSQKTSELESKILDVPDQTFDLSNQMTLSKSYVSENETIIDVLKKIDKKQQSEQKRRPTKSQPKLYISNIKPEYVQSVKKFIIGCTPGSIQKNVIVRGMNVQILFKENLHKQTFLTQIQKPTILSVLNNFGINSKIIISHTEILFVEEKQGTNISTVSKGYKMIFSNYDEKFGKSLQNYLMKCISGNFMRELETKKQGVVLTFKNQSDMKVFYKLCTNKPHCIQLERYGKLKISIVKENEKKQFKQSPKNKQKKQSPVNKTQGKHIEAKLNQTQLLISSLQPNEYTKLTNYLIHNMFYNIQKKLISSKQKYYVRLIFESEKDTKRFLELCYLEQHNKMLAQFTATKLLRVGYQSDSIIVSPYHDAIKNELKNEITKILGTGVINKSQVIDFSPEKKFWKLKIKDSSQILHYYQLLEDHFRSQSLISKNQQYRIKVFVDYFSQK